MSVLKMPRTFPLQLELTYRTEKLTGRGRTSQMGSRSMIADLEPPLMTGAKPQLHVCWPAELDGNKLQLVLQGKVTKVDAEGTHLETSNYEFRLRAKEIRCNWPLRKVA
jgi:hypothetical protein